MRIAICEDMPMESARIRALLDEYLRLNGLTAETDSFPSGEALLAVHSPGKYQIIFLDIYMDKNGLTGMEAAARIRETDAEAIIIFITTSNEHGAQSYDVGAAYYIVKPLDKVKLDKAMEKCRATLNRYAKTIELTENRMAVSIRLRDICYAEAIRHHTMVYTVSREIRTRMPFGELAGPLAAEGFILCHRSYIVNPAHIADMGERNFILKNGSKVPISKTFLRQASEAFKGYFWET